MRKTTFCIEELAVIKAFRKESRKETINSIFQNLGYADDEIAVETMESCIKKLSILTDDEFTALDLSTADQFD